MIGTVIARRPPVGLDRVRGCRISRPAPLIAGPDRIAERRIRKSQLERGRFGPPATMFGPVLGLAITIADSHTPSDLAVVTTNIGRGEPVLRHCPLLAKCAGRARPVKAATGGAGSYAGLDRPRPDPASMLRQKAIPGQGLPDMNSVQSNHT